jgi:hypothetical protein
MISKALRNYLIFPGELTGHAATEFAEPQTLGGLTLLTRNDARRYLRDRVGDRIYAGRRPQEIGSAHTAVTLRQVASTPDLPLLGEIDSAETVIEVNTWTRGVDADYRGELCGRLIQIATSGFVGSWDDLAIGGSSIERAGMQVFPPGGATDEWPFLWSFDIRVNHSQAAPLYSP